MKKLNKKRILFVNPILYTSETRNIKKIKSIKDTMAYGLCQTFHNMGYEIILYTSKVFEPYEDEKYEFEIIFDDTILKNFLPCNKITMFKNIKKYLKFNVFDLVICSECFQISTLQCVSICHSKVIIWQELAKHNNIFFKIPSRIWYNIIVKHKFKNIKIVARSSEAKKFIENYSKNVVNFTISHGVDIKKFYPSIKSNQLIVSSQLIERKNIDKIIMMFSKLIKMRKYKNYLLKICGEGDKKNALYNLVLELKIENNVIFTGKLNHEALSKELSISKCLLIYTSKDNNMISIPESIACGTPVISTSIPYNASFVNKNLCGIINDNWDEKNIISIIEDNEFYEKNCLIQREFLDYSYKVKQFAFFL